MNVQKKTKAEHGRDLWHKLHIHAYLHKGGNDSLFIKKFGEEIPRFMTGCPCNEFWKKWIQTNPPNYDQGKYFEWTVKAHNAVNLKLGKRYYSVEEARAYISQFV